MWKPADRVAGGQAGRQPHNTQTDTARAIPSPGLTVVIAVSRGVHITLHQAETIRVCGVEQRVCGVELGLAYTVRSMYPCVFEGSSAAALAASAAAGGCWAGSSAHPNKKHACAQYLVVKEVVSVHIVREACRG